MSHRQHMNRSNTRSLCDSGGHLCTIPVLPGMIYFIGAIYQSMSQWKYSNGSIGNVFVLSCKLCSIHLNSVGHDEKPYTLMIEKNVWKNHYCCNSIHVNQLSQICLLICDLIVPVLQLSYKFQCPSLVVFTTTLIPDWLQLFSRFLAEKWLDVFHISALNTDTISL